MQTSTEKPAALSRAQILAAEDIRTIVVDVPEWGGAVLVRTMTGTDRDAMEVAMHLDRQKGRPVNMRAHVAAASLVDDAGNLLFTAADIEALGKKNAKALDRIFEASARANGLEEKDIEAAQKN